MKLSVPHNWQEDLLNSLNLANAGEFYGKFPEDITGGGRAANICPRVSPGRVKSEVDKIRAQGIGFNYLLNGTCLDNRELTPRMTKKLAGILDWLELLGCESVTAAHPYVFYFIKKRYPKFRIAVSTMAQVDNPEKAVFWEDLGAEKITLYEVMVNRDFKVLEKIRRAVKCKLQLIANNACLFQCPVTFNHGLLCTHASQSGHVCGGFSIDFYRIMCMHQRLKDPVNIIRADWIRPEDLSVYESLGIDSVKLVNRGMSTAALKTIVQAYTQRSYDGNLLDLFPSPAKNINFKKKNIFLLLRYFCRPQLVNVFRLPGLARGFAEPQLYVDNKKLDGFLAALREKECAAGQCAACGLCRETAQKVITRRGRNTAGEAARLAGILDDFTGGRMFQYFPQR